jgi:hypothetical protein
MSKILICDLHLAGVDLLTDSESYLHELSASESEMATYYGGGSTNVLADIGHAISQDIVSIVDTLIAASPGLRPAISVL